MFRRRIVSLLLVLIIMLSLPGEALSIGVRAVLAAPRGNGSSAGSFDGAISLTEIGESGYRINVTAVKGSGLPQNAKLDAWEILPSDTEYMGYAAASADKLGRELDEFAFIRVFHISIVDPDTGERCVPLKQASFSVELRDEDLSSNIAVSVVGFGGASDGASKRLESSVSEGKVEFSDKGTGVYVITGTSVPRRTYRFYDQDLRLIPIYSDYNEGQEVLYQTVTNGERPIIPQLTSNGASIFAGWYEGTIVNEALVFEPEPFDFDSEFTADEDVDLYAVYKEYACFIFHDQSSRDAEIAFTRRAERTSGTATVRIKDLRAVYGGSESMAFRGWSYDYGSSATVIDADEISTTETVVHLYPVFRSGSWLSFYSGAAQSGANYIPPKFCFDEDEGIRSLRVPERPGYEFLGWYTGTLAVEGGEERVYYSTQITDANGVCVTQSINEGNVIVDVIIENGAYVGCLKITGDVMLFAKWQMSAAADYRIVIWKQKTTDVFPTPDGLKTYEYAESFSLNGSSGETVSVGDEYINRTYPGYAFSRADDPDTVNPDGSTVLNVYYDMASEYVPSGNLHTISFNDADGSGLTMPDPITAGYTAAVTLPKLDPGVPGYAFDWFMDPDCTIPAELDLMPDHDVIIYGMLKSVKFRVIIDPNYGWLKGTGATWFNNRIDEDPIQEYIQIKREYVESSSGTWFYVKHDLDYYEGDPPAGADRSTYYTQNPGEATEYTTFEYMPGVYSYAGWFEIMPDGTEERYEFGNPVDHDTTLKLHWKKSGTYYVEYDAMGGTVDHGDPTDPTEMLFLELDESGYADSAEFVIHRSALPPANSNQIFIGWQVRGGSGTIYSPGELMELNADYAVNVNGRHVITLEAVYTRASTAQITYDANGGVISGTVNFGYQFLNEYGQVVYDSNHEPTPFPIPGTADEENETATAYVLYNNSEIRLGSGAGFERTGAVFCGWSNKQVYDPADPEAAIYTSEDEFFADGEITLYAVWGVSITFHLKRSDTDSAVWAGSWAGQSVNAVTLRGYVGASFAKPDGYPEYTGADGNVFFCWTEAGSDAAYDFSQSVAGDLELYPYWHEPFEVTVHTVDSSAETIVEIGAPSTISVGSGVHGFSGASVPEGSILAFVTHGKNVSDISESEAITGIYYDQAKQGLFVKFDPSLSRDDAPFGDGESIYIVSYNKKQLDIGYEKMELNGAFSTDGFTVSGGAAFSTAGHDLETAGGCDVAGLVTEPLAWAEGFTGCCSFAIGTGNASSASQLFYISEAFESDANRPTLSVRSTWRGIEYSEDGGASWVKCGYDAKLFVLYFANAPTVVMIDECTEGSGSVMGVGFEFGFVVEQITRTSQTVQKQKKNNDGTWSDTEDAPTVTSSDTTESVFSDTYTLRSGEAQSAVLFYKESTETTEGAEFTENEAVFRYVTTTVTEHIQRLTVTQTENSAFGTFVNSTDGTAAQPNVWSTESAASAGGAILNATFINSHLALPVDIHAAAVTDEGAVLKDSWRNADRAIYGIDLAIGDTVALLDEVSPDALFTGSSEIYAFGAVIIGTDSGEGSVISVSSMDAVSVSYERIDGNIYEPVLKDGSGAVIGELGSLSIYYLYYPKPRIKYVKQEYDGTLSEIVGWTADGSPTLDGTVTYDFRSISINGVDAAQDQRVEIPLGGLLISQKGGYNSFRMPPILDDAGAARYLIYTSVAVGNGSGVTDSSEGMAVHLEVFGNALRYSFDGIEWKDLETDAVVYAVYTERGYDLQIEKQLDLSESGEDAVFTDAVFTVTITSMAIKKTKYRAEGAASAEVEARPATDTQPGYIEISVKGGSVVKLKGLEHGEYTIRELKNENYILTAQRGGIVGGVLSDQPVNDLSEAVFRIETETKLVLTNKPKKLCKVTLSGVENVFFTLRKAVEFIHNSVIDEQSAVEMLVDYYMPAGDIPVIPAGMDIVFKTAADGTLVYSGEKARIVRSRDSLDQPMFENGGKLSFINIIVDGNGFENGEPIQFVKPAIVSTSDLTIGDRASVIYVNNGADADCFGAIYAPSGNIVIEGSVMNCRSRKGGAVNFSGNGSITVAGNSEIRGNNSEGDGGALYVSGGTLTLSGLAEVSGNNSEAKGGAVFAENAVVRIEQKAKLSNNSAKNGGAICTESCEVTVSLTGDGGISNNEATDGSGGALYTVSGTLSITNGSIGNNRASVNGGAVYTELTPITVSGAETVITGNSASTGGAIYSEYGIVMVTGGSLTGNNALNGKGGAIFSKSGAVTVSTAAVSGNTSSAEGGAIFSEEGSVSISGNSVLSSNNSSGNGGAVCVDKGSVSLASCTFENNIGENGSAVFVGSGTAYFTAGTSVISNKARTGGAVGFGSVSARLQFSENVQVKQNTLNGTVELRNVYLGRNSDTVINSYGLDSSAEIGVYVPDNILNYCGVPGASFGTYTDPAYVVQFKNDRTMGLRAAEGPNNKIVWENAIKVQARYIASFNGAFPPGVTGTQIYPQSGFADYAPSSGENAASNIASDIYGLINSSSYPTAGFAFAFVTGDTDFSQYITRVDWDPDQGDWKLIRRDGSYVYYNDIPPVNGSKGIVIYYSEPVYVNIENNTEHVVDPNGLFLPDQHKLTMSPFTVLGNTVINNVSAVGFGYIVAKNGVTQDELRPITAEDLMLSPGDSVKLLFPGAGGKAYSFTGWFTGTFSDPVRLRRTGVSDETIAPNDAVNGFTRSGYLTAESGTTTNIIFGGDRPICKIYTDVIPSLSDDETAGQTEPDSAGKVEYLFKTLNQATDFISNHLSTTDEIKIEMLVDYLIHEDDNVSVPAGYKVTFTTAYKRDAGGTYYYTDNPEKRATISRDAGNLKSFIEAGNTTFTYTKLTITDLDFDGKALVGTGNGGAVKTLNCLAVIENASFSGFTAGNGGAVYVEYTIKSNAYLDPNDAWLTFNVSNAEFKNCISRSTEKRQGGGAIWTNAKIFNMDGCRFESCTAVAVGCSITTGGWAQGGAVFHRVDANYSALTKTTIDNCYFANCEARAAGALESDAQDVIIQNSQFLHCKTVQRNGGAFNIYAVEEANPNKECSVYAYNCYFEDCHGNSAGNQSAFGGAMRSTAKTNTVIKCTFKNVTGDSDGGALCFSNTNGALSEVLGCTFEACHGFSSSARGGAVFSAASTLRMDSYEEGGSVFRTSFTDCSAQNAGGAIYHSVDKNNCKTEIYDTDFSRCTSANNGGAAFVKSRSLKIRGSSFTGNYTSISSYDGGAIFYDGSSIYDLEIDSSAFSGNTSMRDGGAVYAKAKTIALKNGSAISNCVAARTGGGIYQNASGADSSITIEDSEISGCEAQSTNASHGYGGGVYSNANDMTVTGGSVVSGNSAKNNGGGLYYKGSGTLAVSESTISGNTSGKQGGGVYTASNVTLSNAVITGNTVSGAAVNAGGMYIPNGKTLTVGKETTDASYRDGTTIRDNRTAANEKSDLRLSETSPNNSVNSVYVLCGLDGYIGVVNAKSKGTQFGSSREANEFLPGFTDTKAVFNSDDGLLFGGMDRADSTHKNIIWRGGIICKYTDAAGNLLYLDPECTQPAVFDALDNGTTDPSNAVAFGILRYDVPPLYSSNDTPYNSGEFYLKMLTDSYTATNSISTGSELKPGLKVYLSTETRTTGVAYPYYGRPGTVCTITRGNSISKDKSLFTIRTNFELKDISVDGGSINCTINGGLFFIGPTLPANVSDDRQITAVIGSNVVLQNAYTNKLGGAIYLDWGASLTLAGGTITGCKAQNGGGVYKAGSAGVIRLYNGSITNCSANESGGGIYYNKPTDNRRNFFIYDGVISNCTAKNGGGIFLNNKCILDMEGGYITDNRASVKGGGIAVGGADSKIYFCGRPIISGNTAQKNGSWVACNLELDQDRNNVINVKPAGLSRNAHIGVYVPPTNTTVYNNHGLEGKPFATYVSGVDTATFYCFVHDIEGFKGGLKNESDDKVYWIKIFSLEVSNTMEMSANAEYNESVQSEFRYTVTISGRVEGWYGDMYFTYNGINSKSSFTLRSGEKMTAVNLSEGLPYEVREELTDGQKLQYSAVPGTSVTGVIGENNVSTVSGADRYISRVKFKNVRPVCKLTTEGGTLLYVQHVDDNGDPVPNVFVPAVYTELKDAFAAMNGSFYLRGEGETYSSYTDGFYRVDMIVSVYNQPERITLNSGTNAALTTAGSESGVQFPFQGSGEAVIRRRYNGPSMLTIPVGCKLEMTKITVNGMKNQYSADEDGSIASVSGELSIGNGATLENSKTSGKGGAIYVPRNGKVTMTAGTVNHCESLGQGAGIYLASGSLLQLSGEPSFGGKGTYSYGSINPYEGNVIFSTELIAQTNGNETYRYARQDIYIEEASESITPILISGDLTGADGSIWVWAEAKSHCLQLMPFAALGSGVSGGNLGIFRNAQTDDATENTTGAYLYGTLEGDVPGLVYWNGDMGSRRVILRKVNGEFDPLPGAKLTVYRGSSTTAYVDRASGIALEGLVSGESGVFWIGDLPVGTYCLHESEIPAGVTQNPGGYWYILTVSLTGVTCSQQYNSRPAV